MSALAALQAQLDATQQNSASEKAAAETALIEATTVSEQRLQQLSCKHAKVSASSTVLINVLPHKPQQVQPLNQSKNVRHGSCVVIGHLTCT